LKNPAVNPVVVTEDKSLQPVAFMEDVITVEHALSLVS
jgi:hypothetical protein